MKLVSCYVYGFGGIKEAAFNFNDGVTSFINKNGAGKTTLASFIKAMFYGLPQTRSNSKKFDDRKRYCPLDGGRFGGSLTFEANGKVYRVERTFGKTGSGDETSVYCGGKLTKELGSDVGASVFGLDLSSFGRTVYITADETESGAGQDIISKLNGEVRAADGGFEEAVKLLEARKRRLKAGRGTGGLIDVKKSERERVKTEAESLRELERSVGEKYRERAELEKRAEELESAFTSPQNVAQSKPENKKGGGYGGVYALCALFAAMFAAGAALCAYLIYIGVALAVAGAAGLAFSLYLLRKKKEEKPAATRDMGEISGVYGELKVLRRRLGALDGEIALTESELERLPSLTAAVARLDKEIEELCAKYEITSLCAEYLLKADGRLKERYVEPVKARFGYYSEIIKPALGGKIRVNEDYSLTFERGGVLADERHLSAGQRCVCGLCLRLALIDNMFPREKPFIILDDPFAALDGENMLGVRRALRELAKHVQIIYFTCHESREV
ncbi:MAG: AAA family ATPase [Clostridia bacterium]|nr:AAA family ATPase [Clostridia bacterium]